MDSPLRFHTSTEEGRIVLSFTPGSLNPERLSKWVARKAPHITAANVADYAHCLREECDPEGDADISLTLEDINERTNT